MFVKIRALNESGFVEQVPHRCGTCQLAAGLTCGLSENLFSDPPALYLYRDNGLLPGGEDRVTSGSLSTKSGLSSACYYLKPNFPSPLLCCFLMTSC